MQRIRFVDSHTAGEPTRVVMEGPPALGSMSIAAQAAEFASRFDTFRSTVVSEPRGSDVLVGALLRAPQDPKHTAGIIFFNNVGCIDMCGHGLIGVVKTLQHLGRIDAGMHHFETPAGLVTATLQEDGKVAFDNVPSYRTAVNVRIEVPGHGPLHGDVAWGGNWFFLTSDHGHILDRSNVHALTTFAREVRKAVNSQGFPEVNHVEMLGPPDSAQAAAKNFVLCPGGVYDRSPCGTGTSAKLACLAASGKLEPGAPWVQQGILGTSFVGSYRWETPEHQRVVPTIRGQAFITAEGELLLDEIDPFREGIRPA
jgi:4-hydroxyproline epimerase